MMDPIVWGSPQKAVILLNSWTIFHAVLALDGLNAVGPQFELYWGVFRMVIRRLSLRCLCLHVRRYCIRPKAQPFICPGQSAASVKRAKRRPGELL